MKNLIIQNDRNLRITNIPILPLLQLVSTDNTNSLWKKSIVNISDSNRTQVNSWSWSFDIYIIVCLFISIINSLKTPFVSFNLYLSLVFQLYLPSIFFSLLEPYLSPTCPIYLLVFTFQMHIFLVNSMHLSMPYYFKMYYPIFEFSNKMI